MRDAIAFADPDAPMIEPVFAKADLLSSAKSEGRLKRLNRYDIVSI
jgi:hypothetical protein